MSISNKILNPKTGRYVLKTGKIGKELLKNLQLENKIEKKKSENKIEEKKLENKIEEKKLENNIELKKININNLKLAWLEIYNELIKKEITDILLIKINENINNLLDIKFSKTEKTIGIGGKGTLILRKMSDIALSKGENTMIYLPKNFNGKGYSKPLWNVRYGYMYYKNHTNLKNIKLLSLIINIINNKYNNYRLSESFINEEKTNINEEKTNGIIGIDIKYDEPEWLSKLIPGNKLFNPIINKNGEIIFSKCAISTKTIELSNKYLNSKLDRFKNINPKYINIKNTNIISKELENFINSSYKISLIAYNRHARIIFKNNEKLHIIDPWKQSADIGTKNLIKQISNLSFIKRKAEQTNEGSCVAISYARALYLSDTNNNINSIYEKIPLDYIVLTSRLISKFRVK
jgi:hypothetical protein